MSVNHRLTEAEPLTQLIANLQKLPGIGKRSATRMALHILQHSIDQPFSLAEGLAQALLVASQQLQLCKRCFYWATAAHCPFCNGERRKADMLLVVENVMDLLCFERSNVYHGQYFVLHGLLAPLEGMHPEQLHLPVLAARVDAEPIREVVVAVSSSIQGDTTTLYITKLLQPYNVVISRLAQGIPLGAELEYLDEATLSQALKNRRSF